LFWCHSISGQWCGHVCCGRGFIFFFVVAIGLCYMVCTIVFSTGGFGNEMEEDMGCLLSFLSQWMLDMHVT